MHGTRDAELTRADPFYGTGATLSALQSTLTTLANTYGKPIMVAETDWPATSCSTALSASYPQTAAGQEQWLQGIVNVLHALPSGTCLCCLRFDSAFLVFRAASRAATVRQPDRIYRGASRAKFCE